MNEPNAIDRRTIKKTTYDVAHLLRSMSRGDLSALRRMHPNGIMCPTFWRVYVSHLALPDTLGVHHLENRWAVILQSMATLLEGHRPKQQIGTALAQAGIHESRVVQLLRASGEPLHDLVRVTARSLSIAAARFDHADIAHLVLSDGHDRNGGPEPSWEESIRRRIAYDFYKEMSVSK